MTDNETSALTVAVTGSTGLIGARLVERLRAEGHSVRRLVRRPGRGPDEFQWDPAAGMIPGEALAGADAVVHLAGESIDGRFTADHKAEVLRSRLESTGTLVPALLGAGVPTLVQASAIGYYGPRRGDSWLTEDLPPGDGFLADVVDHWERAAAPAVEGGARVVFLRTGIVLSRRGGALAAQLPLFRLGLGGRLTHADAWLSWIALEDLVRAYVHALTTPTLSGPVNAVAPAPATQQEFARTVGRVARRPAWLPTPSFGPKLLLGEEGYEELIDTDQRVSADRLVESGFAFHFPTLESALHHELREEPRRP